MNLQERVNASKAIFFDLFHTLFSFKSEGIAGVNTSVLLGIPEEIWTTLIFDASEQRLRGLQHDRYEIIRELAHSYDPGIEETVIRRATDARAERFKTGLKSINKERLEVLGRLKHRGKKLGLISNADSVEVSGWSDSPLSKPFDSVVFSCDTGYIKPEPEIYHIALQSLAVSPEDAVFIGDGGSNELKGAQTVGLTTVLTTEIIGDIWPEKISARAAYADFTISNLNELIESVPGDGPEDAPSK